MNLPMMFVSFRSAFRAALLFLCLAGCLPARATGPGVPADLRSTTVPGTHPGSGTLDTAGTAALVFRSGGQPEISIPYNRITEIHLTDKQTMHLGVLPAILVYLVVRPIRHHTLAITYGDDAGAVQVVAFETDELHRNDAMLVLESRAKQACLDRGEFGTCQPITIPARSPMTTPRDHAAAPATVK